jgi:transposase
MIRDYQAISKTWFLKGHQRIIPTIGKHWGVKLLGVLDYETGHVYCNEEESYDAETFLKFLEKVLEIYPTGEIVMILDNSRIHHAKLLNTFLEDNCSRLTLKYLPPYSPKLNLIEGLWGWLKKDVINNVFHSSVKHIKNSVEAFLNTINKDPEKIIKRLCLQL